MGKNQKSLIMVGILGAIGFVVFLFLLSGCAQYNRLVALDEGVKAAWAQVENQLQRRFDLIPNYVNVVKGYAAHEKEVLTSVTEARAKVGQAQTVAKSIEANNELTSALSRLMVVVENYPNLKADQSFIRLQDELAGTENRIAIERRRYNQAVLEYNKAIREFPTNIIAGAFGFERAEFFQAPQAARDAPRVTF